MSVSCDLCGRKKIVGGGAMGVPGSVTVHRSLSYDNYECIKLQRHC